MFDQLKLIFYGFTKRLFMKNVTRFQELSSSDNFILSSAWNKEASWSGWKHRARSFQKISLGYKNIES